MDNTKKRANVKPKPRKIIKVCFSMILYNKMFLMYFVGHIGPSHEDKVLVTLNNTRKTTTWACYTSRQNVLTTCHNHITITIIFIDTKICCKHIHFLTIFIAYTKDQQYLQTCLLIVIIVVQKQNPQSHNFYKLRSVALLRQ